MYDSWFFSLNSSKPSIVLIDNTPVILSKYQFLENHSNNISNLKDRQLDVTYLSIFLSVVTTVLKNNGINMKLEKWGGRGKMIDSNYFYWLFKIWSF